MVNVEEATVSRSKPSSFRKSYRRVLVDAHVPDWDASFLQKLSPSAIAEAAAMAHAGVITLPSNNHSGLNFWPSSVGRTHAGIGERDMLGEMLSAAVAHGLSTVIYYALCYVEWYWDEHPDSRFVFADDTARRLSIGRVNGAPRFAVVCHNDGDYRAFALTQVRELARDYQSDGFFIDMTMLPGPCYCFNCKSRFLAETGCDIPLIVDWQDETWREYSSRRAAWLAEFAAIIADEIRSIRPEVSIAHQSGAYVGDWWGGASDGLAASTDWLSADVYSSPAALSFGLKLFNSLSANRPADLLNSWTSPAIFEAVVPRTQVELEALASTAIAHDAAFTVIDAVKPDGTFYLSSYAQMAGVFAKLAQMEPYVGGTLVHDVAIYRSFSSAFADSESGTRVEDLGYPDEQPERTSSGSSHPLSSVQAGLSLQRAHIPYAVVTKKDVDHLSRDCVLVVSNIGLMDGDEIDSVRRFVQEGGRLYFSGSTPEIVGADALGDVLGVQVGAEFADLTTYVCPSRDAIFGARSPFSGERPMTIHGRQRETTVHSGVAEVLATVTLPYTKPGTQKYASILSDPPGIWTSSPSIVENAFGLGKTLYCAGVIEAETHGSQRAVFVELIRRLLGRRPAVSASGDDRVEITAFERQDLNSLIVYALNSGASESMSLIGDMTINVATSGRRVHAVYSLPEQVALPFSRQGSEAIVVRLPAISVITTVQIQFDPTQEEESR